ncbi:MAG: alanine--tRNA ligase [Anaerolineales bacterium]|nr:MAG: alanine--tRNA ligase [Anaerolineales bacterium]
MMTSAEIRQAFLNYFKKQGHAIVSSSSLIPGNDPTLLFTNAGMVQFKDAFLGLEKREYTRATTSQKCMRVSGKHNDLENVGPSPRHHTFFEMLGNFSFGDYFKREAIRYAYECLTQIYGLDPDQLYYTVHTDDDEAFGYWVDDMQVDPERVYRMGDKTNFWMMGDTGPCGPTSELHYDWGPEFCTCGQPDCSVALDNGCERWLEIWNLVFMQFNQAADGSRTPLPKPGVDTGMGLERIVSVVQNKRSNYETDLFTPIMDRVQELLGHSDAEREKYLVSYRVIADHGRAVTFMIGDGVMPGNEGRRYVLRLILRRAARHGRMAGFSNPFLAEIARVVFKEMGAHYAELKARQEFILNVIAQEEERFYQTYEFGLKLLTDLMDNLKGRDESVISGPDAFKLHATYGFPFELTRDIALEHGLLVDEAGFRHEMTGHEKISASDQFKAAGEEKLAFYANLLEKMKTDGQVGAAGVKHSPYDHMETESQLVSIIRDGQVVQSAREGELVELVLAATPFYVEAGGQIGDTGLIVHFDDPDSPPAWEFQVTDSQKPVTGLIVHVGQMTTGVARPGDEAQAIVDLERRWDIMRNHTATHLLHSELRRVLGEHVQQAGSLVAVDRLRFDFTHPGMLTQEELLTIESSVNDAILVNHPIRPEYHTYKEAVAAGAIALFGEKYGDAVRVVKIGDEDAPFSQELCGGTHVHYTGDIGFFHIVSEGSVAAGVRRIEAVTGRYAYQLVQNRMATLDATAAFLGCAPDEVDRKVLNLMGQLQNMEKAVEKLQRQLARQDFERLLSRVQEVSGINVLSAQVEATSVAMLREMSDWFRDRLGSGVIVLGAVLSGKPSLVAAVTPDLLNQGLHAGTLVKAVAQEVGGGGGGKPTLAQAGGRDASRLTEALSHVPGLVEQSLKR